MSEIDDSKPLKRHGSIKNLAELHRRFPGVQSYVDELGGDKGRVIEKILIANNGVAAVKAIRSIRRWAYEVFGNEKAISFVVMATPEDLRANAEYIRMGDTIVDVPGGSNNHNYANVTLIVELARLHGVHAVWAGWGHASEKPSLPNSLAASIPPIKFIGPAGPPMNALGDKIGSTIIAQSAGVPCIAWNGSDVKAEYNRETGCLPPDSYDAATVKSAAAATAAASKIGFPVMIKASEGGGGKGIRKVDNPADVADAYRQVCGEVPGSPIFIMKLSSQSRHLEVQLLADEYGNAVALNGRDCSVQRRHQKIIEEGPPIAAPPQVWTQMERAAVNLAKAVGYTNAGTVEYLYSETDEKFYFLELNPRLQVEHPVTEMITKVNLPACQLQVAMGIPLYNIPDIRQLYGKNRFANDISLDDGIDFDTAKYLPPVGHCIAVRITAENAEAGFKPTSGGIQELNFRSTPNVWGYFSMDSSGSIHEFADSQFGHLFASGNDREQARRNMVLALKELSIRGDISTTVDYISRLIELDSFVENEIDTSWLDGIIKENVSGIGSAVAGSRSMTRSTSFNSGAANDAPSDIYPVIGAVVTAYNNCSSGEKEFLELLTKGQLPPQSLLAMSHNIELILDSVKYKLTCTRTGMNTFSVATHNNPTVTIETSIRKLSDGGYLTIISGKSHVAYLTSRGDAGSGMRLDVGGVTVAFSPDYDPTQLRTDVAGKLVKKLVPDGSTMTKGQPYAEIEVMKMVMPLRVEESGVLTWKCNEGAALVGGHLLATLELAEPENVAQVQVFEGELDVVGEDVVKTDISAVTRPHILFCSAVEKLKGGMAGYVLKQAAREQVMRDIQKAVTDPSLPVYDIDDKLSVLNGRIDSTLFSAIAALIEDYKKKYDNGSKERFPVETIAELLSNHSASISDFNENAAFMTLTAPLQETVTCYCYADGEKSASDIPGANRALAVFLDILRSWIIAERWFCDAPSYADAVDNLRRAHKDDTACVLAVCRAHAMLHDTCGLVKMIIDTIGGNAAVVVPEGEGLLAAVPCLSDIGAMSSFGDCDSIGNVALQARKLLLQESSTSISLREEKVKEIVNIMTSSPQNESSTPKDVQSFINDNVPFSDIFFSVLESLTDDEAVVLFEIYARNLYRIHSLRQTERDTSQRAFKFVFLPMSDKVLSTANPVTSMTDLTRIVSRASLADMAEMGMTRTPSEGNLLSLHRSNNMSPLTPRTAVFQILSNLSDLDDASTIEKVLASFPEFKSETAQCSEGPVNVLHVAISKDRLSTTADETSTGDKIQEALQKHAQLLRRAAIRRVTILIGYSSSSENPTSPALFTYRSLSDFKEDILFRDVEPNHAYHLDITRLARNFSVKGLISRQTIHGHIHLYRATPNERALSEDKKANKSPRIFVRAFSFAQNVASAVCFERIVVDALNALDISPEIGDDNHLFINLVNDFERVVVDPAVLEQVVVSILNRHNNRITRLGVAQVEARFVCCLSTDSPPIAIRMVASNPTGYVLVTNSYVEAANETNTKSVFKLIGGTKATLAGSGDSSWEGMSVSSPYPLTRPFDAQRKAALRASDTLYCYDLPALFEAAVERQWSLAATTKEVVGSSSGDGEQEQQTTVTARPLMVMYTSELVVERKDGSAGPWTMADYLNGDLKLTEVQRGAGANDVGMVAWLMILKTTEYPNGRQVVLIANDITHKAGSFGTREDVVFKLASEYAREKRIPRLYVAANSGARIGTAEGVKKAYKVKFKDPSHPENGFEYLYVDREDYERLGRMNKEIVAEEESEGTFRITDIVGAEPDLGVENLKGSGLIAGETSSAYNDIFTMTIVLGRTVGIGAYLVRLGQRTIQKTTASPIILTGYQALNKLMGCDVYSTNDQLGGPGIMYSNGVSHLVASDHLRAISAAVDWLSYVPSVRGGLLPITDIRGSDTVERNIDFEPKAGVPYDPRYLIAGGEDDDGVFQNGFFDKGSFTETLAGWAKSVIVGRARLGGIPMGVIATENRTAEAIKPADPADVKASEAVIREAGCVWFPNSAYKTAQAINDFRTEDLPLMIFANWRGFSGGQRDMFDEVLKYGSLIVDAFVAHEQPVFVLIPPHAEIRGGAWVVLDASINSSVMELYATAKTARGGVLEANGAASVKYRMKDLIPTMHRLDENLKEMDSKLNSGDLSNEECAEIKSAIKLREQSLLPVYEQIAVQFCDLHDTPGRMKAVGVIEKEVEWKTARTFFFWRLRRKLAEFDLRRKIVEAAEVGRSVRKFTPLEASGLIKQWFLQTPGMEEGMWNDDRVMLSWMAQNYKELEGNVINLTKEFVSQEVLQVLTAGGNTALIGTMGMVEGLAKACQAMGKTDRENFKKMVKDALDL